MATLKLGNKMKTISTKQSAHDRFVAHRKEINRRLELLTAAVNAPPTRGMERGVHWGHVGDFAEISTLLGRALNHAGVEEFIEH
jgi:hypothetical protein